MRDLKCFSVKPLQCKKPLQKPKVSRIIAVSCDFTHSAGVAVSCDMNVAESDDLRRVSSKTHDSHTIFINFQYFHKEHFYYFIVHLLYCTFFVQGQRLQLELSLFCIQALKILLQKIIIFLTFLLFSARQSDTCFLGQGSHFIMAKTMVTMVNDCKGQNAVQIYNIYGYIRQVKKQFQH